MYNSMVFTNYLGSEEDKLERGGGMLGIRERRHYNFKSLKTMLKEP